MKNTTEMNRVIAEYMGVKETTGYIDSYGSKEPHYWTGNGFHRTSSYSKPGLSFGDFIEHSNYHKSWDWLMPVWKKLLSDLLVKIEDGTTYWRKEDLILNEIADLVAQGRITQAHQSIYNAIVYLNKVKEGKG